MPAARILVVDDEPQIRHLIAAMLMSAGHQASEAATARDALDMVEAEGNFDLILTDIMMAGMDGIALLERLRQTHPEIPVVMVTAVHDVAVAISAIRQGAYDYLSKPFEREQLMATVKRALEHRRLNLQNVTYKQNLENLVAARTEMLRQAIHELERSYDITLEALGDALDLKDAETEGHSKRVTAYSIALAKAMGMSAAEIRTIARGAFLHDIGKMAIPDAILLKPGPLTEEERIVVQDHCARGYNMLRKIPFLREAAEIVYSHQERFDGSGYPRRLQGDQIPTGARIFTVADTLDAITSDRPYRKAQGLEDARKEIARCAGTQFDPTIVEVYLSLPDSTWEDLRAEIGKHARQFSPFSFAMQNGSRQVI